MNEHGIPWDFSPHHCTSQLSTIPVSFIQIPPRPSLWVISNHCNFGLPFSTPPTGDKRTNLFTIYDCLSEAHTPQQSSIFPSEVLRLPLLSLFNFAADITKPVTEIFDSWFLTSTCLNILTFNLLATKCRLFYLKTQSVPRGKHFSSRL
jgi:hypothetical protein